MKGEALIIVKDKNGNIKKQIREKNTVFDIPKELIKDLISEADLGPLGGNSYNQPGNEGATASSTITSPFAAITGYASWFRFLKLNDEVCSTTDFKDYKYPVLAGGEQTAVSTANKRYAYIDTTRSIKSGAIMKKYYTWVDCPAFTLRSLNLCHGSNARNFSQSQDPFTYYNEGNNTYCYARKKGKFYYDGAANRSSSLYFGNPEYGYLATKREFTWDLDTGSYTYNDQGSTKFDKLATVYNYSEQSASFMVCAPNITALKDSVDDNDQPVEEIAVFRYHNDMTTSDTSNQYWKYIKILDANTGTERRSFSYAKFSGISSSSSGVQCMTTWLVATDFGTFLMQSTAYSSGSTKIWKIPETQTDDTIQLYATISETTFNPYNYRVVINDVIIDEIHHTAIKINNDANDPYKFMNYFAYNANVSTMDSTYRYLLNFNKYYKIAAAKAAQFETWYNTTVLNLSTPLEISAGDTLSIEYTITVS